MPIPVRYSIPTAPSARPLPISGRAPVRGMIFVCDVVAREHDGERHRQEGQAGLDRREAEVLLQVVRQEQEDAEHRDRRQAHREVGAAAVTVEDDAQRQQRVGDALLDRHEPGEQGDARDQEADRGAVRPRRLRRVREAVDQREQAGARGERARDVQARLVRAATCWSTTSRAPNTATPANARFTYRHQRQDRYSVSTPPMSRPTAAPEPAIAPKIPNALLRSLTGW